MLLSLLTGSGASVARSLSHGLSPVAVACAVAWRLAGQHAGDAASCHFHSSSTSSSDADGGGTQPSTSSSEEAEATTAAAAAVTRPRGPVHAPHLPLDHTEFDIVLRYNSDFVTDPDRSYAIGHTRAFERVMRQELRKALAAQRLFLKDTAAAYAAGPAGTKQPPMREQMLRRLSEMREHVASS